MTYAIVGYLRSIIFLSVDDDDADDEEDDDGDGGREGSLRNEKRKRLTLEEMQKVADDRKSACSLQRMKSNSGMLIYDWQRQCWMNSV